MEWQVIKNLTVSVPSEDIVAREIEGRLIIVPFVSGIGEMEDELYALKRTGKAIRGMCANRKEYIET